MNELNQSGWDEPDARITRGNRGMIVAFLLLLIVGAVVGVFWYKDKLAYEKWDKELKAALKLPDGEFEAKLRDILANSNRKDILAQAAFELGEAKDEGAVPVLAKTINIGGVPAREAAKALAKIGNDEAKSHTDPIFQQLQKAEGLARAEYAWAMCMLGDARGFGPLLEAVGSRVVTAKSLPEFDPDVIVRIGTTDKLIEMAASPDPMFRMYAAMELGYRTDQDVVPPLLQLVRDKNLDVAEAAAISLGRTTDKRAGPALLQTMKEKEQLRDSILGAITQSVGSPGLETIYASIQNDPDFKYKIIGKLKALRDPRSKDLLFSILNEEFPGSDKEAVKQADQIRNQALWILEELGDPRIAEAMFEKANWEPATEEQIPDAATRYRENDLSRKIANGTVTWFGKVRPEGASDYLMKIYDTNQPYSNTPECAQRVKVDIGPLMDAMGRTGDKKFCPLITPFLDKDEGFYFQAASHAIARLNCPGALDTFKKRMMMTAAERKEGSFAALLETRNWQMENRLQERRNSIMALKFLGSPSAADNLMQILLDPKDDQELRKEAASSLVYCADESTMNTILQKIKDDSIDIVARAALIQGLWLNPSETAIGAMMEILEGQGNFELVKPAAIAVGEAANPALEARLNKLLDHADEQRQRAAVLAILLGGNMEQVDKIIELLKGQENKLVIREWYESHDLFLSREIFDSKRIYKRLINAQTLADKTERTEEEILWPWKHLMQRMKNGWEDGPGGLSALDIRELLAETVRSDKQYAELAGKILSGLNERGYLLALQSEKGPQSLIARNILRQMNIKSQ